MGLQELLSAEHRDIFRGWFIASILLTAGLVALGASGVAWLQDLVAWATYGLPALAMTAMSGWAFHRSARAPRHRDEWQDRTQR